MKRHRFRIRSRTLAVGMLFVLLLASCGQKGDLYLPADGQTEQQQAK